MTDFAVLLDEVRKRFGDVEALRGVNFNVVRGEVFGFLGPNGSGKTTTIRVLMGFIKANAGRAEVLGLDAAAQTVEIKRQVGYLPDTIAFSSGLTGDEFLRHIARLHGVKGVPPMQRELLDRLELPKSALRRGVKGYSTGMAKKLALVQAMQHDPELLILDEPTESLDPLMRQQLFGVFHDLQHRGVTVFMSSHVLADVEEICERVALIRSGQIVSFGPVDGLREGGVRTMVVTLRDAEAPFVLDGATVAARQGAVVKLSVEGDINDVVRGLARYDLQDVVYERMSLEDLFMSFYRDGKEPTVD